MARPIGRARATPARSKRAGANRRRDVDRTEKREFVSTLGQVFAQTSMVVVTQNKGLTVAEVSDLRRKMRASGSTFKVAKNRLAILALEGTRFDGIKPMLKGPTALAWSIDPVAVAKAAVDYAKTNEKFVVIGGALGTQTLDADGIKALADLPSLDTLRGRLVGMIQTPGTRIAAVLAAPAGQLARVFGAYAKKDEAEAA
ncbi:MAG: 50S ribosomal protein L10 [Gemmatimonadaceae bacterium]|nr:50S ribosomal protein L10 [Acetobacteraceae bacterium]